MPLTRYQIRNEFNLADPDLYRASDKDDPEALLEGVAMAGLVGILRQLGDLAEFAAEIFHDLHEEVMATAARGHGLTARIQQLEADVPLIEKNLLSQTDHTSFYYNIGIDWHPQICTDQNLITQGDMPRFIRDSYEECRGPPQLFLLDKFDVGGAGACLKRYTDPSSFKAESTTSDAAKLEGQRDRRTRKIKRKGTHWRNGDTPEVLTTSHAKLHQLLIEERIGNDNKVPARHVKLKKRTLDGSKISKSYMEKFLHSMSPEHSESHETEVGQPTLRLTYNHIDDSVREILDIQPVSAAEDSLYFSPTDQETKLRPTAMYSYDFSKSRRSKGSTISVEDGNSIGTASPLRVPVAEKELGIYGENRHINGITSLYSDDMASETENYMDAVANMESEAETDNEYNPKKELRYFSKHMGVGKPREQVLIVRDRLFDSQSVENSITSDDGSMSFMKVTSTSSLHGAPYNEEHGDREAESSLSMSACDALNVDYKQSFDYDETKKSTSNWCLNSNGKNVGSSATSFDSVGGDISFVKESSHLLQSSESGSSLRHFNLTSAEGIYDSECPQGDRSRLTGYDDTIPDDPCKDDNVSVIQTSMEGHEPKASSEVLAHFSNDLSHDHFKRSSMLENGTSQNVYIDEFLSDDLADNELESPQSATDTQLLAFDQGHRNGDSRSNLVLPGDDHVGNDHAIYSKYVNARFSSEEVPDGSNHAMDSTREMYGSFLAETDATNLLEINAVDDSRLIATQKELAVTKLLADGHDSEGHISFEQSDSHRLHADSVTNSTDLRVEDQNPELGHFPIHFDAASFPSSNHELLFYQEAVPKVSEPQCRQISISNEVPEVDFSTQDNSLKLEGEEMIFPKDSTCGDLQTETNVEGAPPLPPLPPIQWIAGKPQDSFPDSDRESEEHITAPNGSLPSFGFGLKGSFHFTPVDEDIKQPLKATQTDENSTQTSSLYPGGFSLTDSTQQLNDTIDVHDQHRLLTTGTDSYADNPRTYLQNGQSEPLSFAAETPQPSSGTYLPASLTNIDASTTEAVQASDDAQFSVPMLGEMTTHAKETIQPTPAAHAVLSAGETAEPSASWESLQPKLEDKIMNVSDASEVPITSADQSLEESISYSRTEHAARSVDEKIINQLEALGLQNENEEHHKQKMNPSEREATWSLALLNYEDEKLAQKPAVKPPRPRNPLIDSVNALDRSKLKKVTPRKQPEKPTVDERGSMLEQIRTKSFNLKPAPAPVPKPSIQAPTMNLKVAAILEKANKIRRATAGSDEDEDEWSDD